MVGVISFDSTAHHTCTIHRREFLSLEYTKFRTKSVDMFVTYRKYWKSHALLY
jgi:hypothetical protein